GSVADDRARTPTRRRRRDPGRGEPGAPAGIRRRGPGRDRAAVGASARGGAREGTPGTTAREQRGTGRRAPYLKARTAMGPKSFSARYTAAIVECGGRCPIEAGALG